MMLLLFNGMHIATHCNTLQLTATHCNSLQHTAIHCNTLQHPFRTPRNISHCRSILLALSLSLASHHSQFAASKYFISFHLISSNRITSHLISSHRITSHFISFHRITSHHSKFAASKYLISSHLI